MKKTLLSLTCILYAYVMGNATVLSYSTFLGTGSNDYCYDIGVTDNGEAIVIGSAENVNFPTTSGAFDPFYSGGSNDIFVSKLTGDGSGLLYSTYLGGSDGDRGYGIAVENGIAYITGTTSSTNFPLQNPFSGILSGSIDVFVSKLSINGDILEFSTYLGGSSSDFGKDIAVQNGNAFITGYTASSSFPLQNPYDSFLNGGSDAFITKLSTSGDSIEFSTFLGGSSNDHGNGIALENGNAFVTGVTTSSNFPLINAFNSTYGGSYDAFVTKLSITGNNLEFSTYLGGSSQDEGHAISIENGKSYVLGSTYSSNFPTQNSYSNTMSGFNDIFVTKFTTNGSLDFSTFLGGSDTEYATGITVDNGKAIIIGTTNSSDFPMKDPIDPSYNGSSDYFVTQLNLSGTSLDFSTYLGGSNSDLQSDYGNTGIYKNGSLFLNGYTESSDFPITNGAFDSSHNGNKDAIIIRLQMKIGDLSPTSLLSPDTTNAAQSFNPQFQISNLDSSFTTSVTTANIEISFNGNLIFTDTKTLPAIAPISDSTITFSTFTPYKSGTYEIKVYTELGNDINTSNDTLVTYIEVIDNVVINEFMPIGNSTYDPSFTEFFEIANTTNQILDISNWQIRNSIGEIIIIANGTLIPANSFFVFTKFDNAILNGGIPFDYFYNTINFSLTDNSGYLLVKDSNAQVVDSVNYFGWATITQGESFERKNYKLDSSDENSWCHGTTVYGTENNKGTPGSLSSCYGLTANGLISESSIDFGNVVVGTTSNYTVTLYSNGDGNLTVDSLQVLGSSGFTTNLTGVSIPTGDSTNFNVSFTPTIENTVSGNLIVYTNDWDSPPFQISLNGKGVDAFPPSQITDFVLISHSGTSLKLRWTATGEDTTAGTATSYEIRQSTSEITESNFSLATLVPNIPAPSQSGALDSVTVTGLTSGIQYYFGIKAFDNNGNESPLATQSSLSRAEITSITDVQNDNGGNLRISFNASFNDYNSTGINVSGYSVFRKLNPNFSPSSKSSNQIFESLPSGNWEQVAALFAFGDQTYTAIVPTLADSNSTGIHEFEFLVRVQAFGNGAMNSVSKVVSGYSLDNLAPSIPTNQNFTSNGNGTTTASWNKVLDLDLEFYTIWAENPNGDFTLITQVLPSGSSSQNETFTDIPGAVSYIVGSVDINGNESLPFINRITSLKIVVVGNDVTLNWFGKQNASLYKIYRGTTTEFSNLTQIGTFIPSGISPSFTDSGVASNFEKYFYFVTWEN